jgi:FKBP-type peptidyl-prolyl cis-trans isomerase FklB
MKVLTAAQIGCGKFAHAQDLPNMTAHPEINLKWVCDNRIENAQSAAKEFGVPNVTDDFMDVINDETKLFIDSIKITQQMAQMELQRRVQDKMNERARVEYAPNLKAGEEFLAAKAQEEGVVALKDGVLYKVIKEGKKNGKKPTLTDKIKVAYKGMTIDGEEFDSNEGVEFPLASMIEGWKIAIPEMTEGSKWEIYIPYNLAYGERGSMPNIKPFSALVFEVELFNVVAPATKK